VKEIFSKNSHSSLVSPSLYGSDRYGTSVKELGKYSQFLIRTIII